MEANNEKLEDFSWDSWDENPIGEVKQEPIADPVKETPEQPQEEAIAKKEVEESP